MNAKLLCCCLLLTVFPLGCVASKQKANDLAEQALYKPVTYENASVPGPEVVVLPGEIKSFNYAFLNKVTSNNLRDFAEIELAKDNFTVLDRADTQPLFQEIALAANLGDAEALRVFRKGKFKSTNWFVTFNILKAEPTVYVVKGFDGETLGALIDLGFTIANKGGKSSAGKMIGQTVASAKTADTSAIWLVGLQYKILNAATGEQVASGYVEDKMEATTSMNSFLGVTNKQGTSVSLDTMAQRLIQKAVAEIDKKYKTAAGPGTESDEKRPGKGKARDGIDPKKEKVLLTSYKKKLEEHALQQDKEQALTTMRCHNDGYANLNQETVLATLAKENHEKFHKRYDQLFKYPEKAPKWRDTLKIDMAQVTYELAEYKADACKVKVGGTYTVTDHGKTKAFAKNAVVDMVKEDGAWKVASWTDEADKEVGQ